MLTCFHSDNVVIDVNVLECFFLECFSLWRKDIIAVPGKVPFLGKAAILQIDQNHCCIYDINSHPLLCTLVGPIH